MASDTIASFRHEHMANSHGFDTVESYIKQIVDLFGQCRNVLQDIEENLAEKNQLRAGEEEIIQDVVTEFIRCSSSVSGVWDRIVRFKNKAVIAQDDSIIYDLDRASLAIESTIYHKLRSAQEDNTFLDYRSLIKNAAEESKPLVDALKDLVSRLRSPGGSDGSTSAGSFTRAIQPPTLPIRSPSRNRAQSAASFMTVKDPNAALGSSRFEQHGYLPIAYDPQIRNGSALNSSAYSSDEGDEPADKARRELIVALNNNLSLPESQPWDSRRTSDADNFQRDSTVFPRPPPRSDRRPPPLHIDQQGQAIPPIQEEPPELERGSMSLAPAEDQPDLYGSQPTSRSADTRRLSEVIGEAWRESYVHTPDTCPSPVSPDLPIQSNQSSLYNSDMDRSRAAPARRSSLERKFQQDISKDWTDVGADFHTTNDSIGSSASNFGPPSAPPPNRHLPAPPKPGKVSLYPAPDPRDSPKPTQVPPYQQRVNIRGTDGKLTTMSPEYKERMQGWKYPYPQLPTDFQFPPVGGTHGLKINVQTDNFTSPLPDRTFSPPLSSAGLPNSPTVSNTFSAYTRSVQQPPRQQLEFPAKPVKPKPKAVKTKAVNSYLFGDEEPIPKKVKNPSGRGSLKSRDSVAEGSRSSLAPTVHSNGSASSARWISLTSSIRNNLETDGFSIAPCRSTKSKVVSSHPADNLPSESNNYGLCKTAIAKLTGDAKKSFEESASRPLGVMGSEKYMRCKKCKYEWNAYAKSTNLKTPVTDTRWQEGPAGILYKESLLFKSHLPEKSPHKPHEGHEFGCIFCASLGKGMPVYLGMTSFLTHLAEHGNGRYPSDALKTRIKFTTRVEWENKMEDEYHELILP